MKGKGELNSLIQVCATVGWGGLQRAGVGCKGLGGLQGAADKVSEGVQMFQDRDLRGFGGGAPAGKF